MDLASSRRVLRPGEIALEPDEQALLDRICEAYYLPAWCSVADYQRLFEAEGLQVTANSPAAVESGCGALLWRQVCGRVSTVTHVAGRED